MSRRITRLILLLALGGALFAAARSLRRRRTAAANAAARSPEWPPFEPRVQPGAAPASVQDAAEPSIAKSDEQTVEAPAWLSLEDGACPDGYPIKANDNSRIYHVPGGRSYERTIAERCYATAQAAERDGYRRAKA